MSNLLNIIIPTFNDQDVILDAVKSAVEQKGDVIVNVIVINDGGNDHTEEILRNSSYWNKIKYFYKENGGVASARNVGLSYVKEGFCCFLDSDDLLELNYAETMINFLKNNNYKAAYCDYNLCDVLNPELLINIKEIHYKKNFLINDLLVLNRFMTPTVIFDINIAKSIKFNEEMKYNEDWLFWIDLIKETKKIYYCDNKLVRIRTRNNGLTSKKDLHLIYYKKAINKIECKYISKKTKEVYYAYSVWADNLITMKDYKLGCKYLIKSLKAPKAYINCIIIILKEMVRIFAIEKLLRKIIRFKGDRRMLIKY